jgi:2-amino-4-hydroxy-6-hydroxymethyldihydropteridine diphosphokinase
MRQLTKVVIGLGSNLGDREGYLRRAAERLAEEFLEGAVASSVYESEPWGVLDQPKFLNAAITGLSEWKPPAMMNYLKTLERELGRTDSVRYGPREIDLDLLAYGELVWNSEGVIVPHERLPERNFVLLPFAELWPEWRHPALEKTAAELLGQGSFGPDPVRLPFRLLS